PVLGLLLLVLLAFVRRDSLSTYLCPSHDHVAPLHSVPHDALPICQRGGRRDDRRVQGDLAVLAVDRSDPNGEVQRSRSGRAVAVDRKSTRLNSSHVKSSYAVFCLKKKTNTLTDTRRIHHRRAHCGP